MKYPILVEFDSNIELNPSVLGTNVLSAVRRDMPEIPGTTVFYGEGVHSAIARLFPPTPPAPTYSAPDAPDSAVLAAVLEAGRSILATESEAHAQSENYEHLLDAYERLVSLIATSTTDDPSIITLSRAALTAGLF